MPLGAHRRHRVHAKRLVRTGRASTREKLRRDDCDGRPRRVSSAPNLKPLCIRDLLLWFTCWTQQRSPWYKGHMTAGRSSPRRPSWLSLAAATAAGILLVGLVILSLLPGSVSIESHPSSAIVYVNGQPAGHTPLVLSGRGPAVLQVGVEMPGYSPWVVSTRVEPRSLTLLYASLSPMQASLTVESDPPGAAVRVNGREVGTTPIAGAEIAMGRHQLVLSMADHEDWRGEFDAAPGAQIAQRIGLRPLPAHLSLSASIGNGTASIDGQPAGQLPVLVDVEPGDRRVRIEAQGYRPWETLVHLSPNESHSLEADLQRPWPVNEEPVSPLAVVIENQALARPQSGLNRADVVYEALVEGGITRFLALYATQDAEVVGPVRSARHYFVYWANEYNAPLVNIGWSPQAGAAINATGIRSIDETRGSQGFWRTRDRAAPHNAYISTAGARSGLGDQVQAGSFGGLAYKTNQSPYRGTAVDTASVTYGGWNYVVEWKYESGSDEWIRSMERAPHVDAASGEPIRASNVLMQWVDSWPIPGDTEGRLEFDQVGRGRIIALVDGVAVEGVWSKPSLEDPTQYQDLEGNPIRLNAGPTWIQVLPLDGTLLLQNGGGNIASTGVGAEG
ncbi:MAG: DUF3048 domain-containing protein [Chloroflexi bacterium]|nr:DUF3048 domain-containing protein [Chloroflexota bacterium]